MKKHLLIIIEAILSLLILSLFAGLCIIEHKLLLIVLALMGSIFFVYKVVLGVRLIIDIIEGPREKIVVFAGALGEEHLVFFGRLVIPIYILMMMSLRKIILSLPMWMH